MCVFICVCVTYCTHNFTCLVIWNCNVVVVFVGGKEGVAVINHYSRHSVLPFAFLLCDSDAWGSLWLCHLSRQQLHVTRPWARKLNARLRCRNGAPKCQAPVVICAKCLAYGGSGPDRCHSLRLHGVSATCHAEHFKIMGRVPPRISVTDERHQQAGITDRVLAMLFMTNRSS